MLFFPLQLTGDCIKSDIKKYKKSWGKNDIFVIKALPLLFVW